MALISLNDISVEIGIKKPTVIIGERINPTGKIALSAEFQAGKMDLAMEYAQKQKDTGVVDILDVNVGAAGVDQVEFLPKVVKKVVEVAGLPICIDSSSPDALVAALRVYPGKALVNSVTGEEKSLSRVLPAIKEYGASVVGLAMDDDGIPQTAQKRFDVARKIVDRAVSIGIPKENVVIDCLTMTASVDQDAASIILEALSRVIDELGVPTVLGVSNISFGMPERNLLNKTFISMAIKAGLCAAIIDPNAEGMIDTIYAADFLDARDPYGGRYIGLYRKRQRG